MTLIGKRERIDDGTRDLMIVVALAIEFFSLEIDGMFSSLSLVVGLVPPVGPALGLGAYWFGEFITGLIATAGYLIFILWFHLRGYSLRDWDLAHIALIVGTWILELLPFVSILPWFLIGVIRTIYLVRRKDRDYNEKYATKAGHEMRHANRFYRSSIRAVHSNPNNFTGTVGGANASSDS